MQKVVIEVEDFNKIVQYITTQPVAFRSAQKAVEIDEILKRVKVGEVKEEPEVKGETEDAKIREEITG